MGKMNLLKAGYTGKVGQIYGTKGNNKIIAKAVPFSHAPHNETQKECFSAFGALQRTCSAIYKSFWSYLGLSDKKMNKLNATAHLFKPIIKNHTYQPANVADFINSTNKISFLNATYEEEENAFKVTINIDANTPRGTLQKVFIGVFDDVGACYSSKVIEPQTQDVLLPTNKIVNGNAIFLSFGGITKESKSFLQEYCVETITI